MDNKRILIIGCSGSGKSTLAQKLGSINGLPIIHLDNLYWGANWIPVSEDIFDELLLNELVKNSWIIEGNYNRTLTKRLDFCDTVIFLDISRLACIFGVFRRRMRNNNQLYYMGGNNPKFFDYKFIKWIWNFNKTNRSNYYRLLSESNKNAYFLRSHREVIKFLNKVQKKR